MISPIVWNLVFDVYMHLILHATNLCMYRITSVWNQFISALCLKLEIFVWKDHRTVLSVWNQFISSLCLKLKILVWKEHHFVSVESMYICSVFETGNICMKGSPHRFVSLESIYIFSVFETENICMKESPFCQCGINIFSVFICMHQDLLIFIIFFHSCNYL